MTLVLLAAGMSAAALPAARAADWTAPATVAKYGYDPVAVGAPGDGQIVFAGGSPERLLTVRRSGSAFLPPRTLLASPPRPDRVSYAFDGLGGAVLVYAAGAGARARVMVQSRSPSGALGFPRAIATAGPGAALAVVAVARSGAAVVAWPGRSPRGWRVRAVTRLPGRGFGAPQMIGKPSRLLREPWVAVGDGGDALVVWHRQNYGDDHHGRDLARLWAAFSVRGGRFGRSVVLGDGGDWSDLALSVSGAGRMLAAWIPFNYRGQDQQRSRLQIAERAADAGFGPARTLAAATTPGSLEDAGPVAAVADDGSALVAWLRPTGGFGEFYKQGTLEALTRAAGGDFILQTLTGPQRAPAFPVLALGRDGTVALIWTEAQRDAPGFSLNAHPLASVSTIGAPLPVPTALSTVAETRTHCECATWPSAMVSDAGDVIATWVEGPTMDGPIRVAVRGRQPAIYVVPSPQAPS